MVMPEGPQEWFDPAPPHHPLSLSIQATERNYLTFRLYYYSIS